MSPRNTSFPLITRDRGSYCAQFDGTSRTLFYVSALLCTSSTNQILVQVQQHFCQNTLDTQFELYLLCGGKIVSYVKTPARNLAVLSKIPNSKAFFYHSMWQMSWQKREYPKYVVRPKISKTPFFRGLEF